MDASQVFPAVVDFLQAQPAGVQIALVAGGLALAVVCVVATYYILKYLVLLVYHLLRAAYKGVSWGVKKARGNPGVGPEGKPARADPVPASAPEAHAPRVQGARARVVEQAVPRFCGECGHAFSEASVACLIAGQTIYCEECGSRHETPRGCPVAKPSVA